MELSKRYDERTYNYVSKRLQIIKYGKAAKAYLLKDDGKKIFIADYPSANRHFIILDILNNLDRILDLA